MLGCERASALPHIIGVFITNGGDVKQGDTYSGAVVSTVNSHQREFSMFSLRAWVLSECSGSHLEFRNMLVRPVGNSKLGCRCECKWVVSPAMWPCNKLVILSSQMR